jgi:hypothetical protein
MNNETRMSPSRLQHNLNISVRDSLDSENTSIDNKERKELLWETRIEDIVNKWASDSLKRAELHTHKAERNKKLYAIFSMPGIIIPIILSGVSSIIVCNGLIYSIAMMFVGIISGIAAFYNFGKKSELNFNYADKYFRLSTDVESELSKHKVDRIACDVYLEKTRLMYSNLCSSAPNL